MSVRWLLGLSVIVATPVKADAVDELSGYVGYTIVASKRIVRWVSSDRSNAKDGFEGCEYGRIIVFDDNTALKCTTYGYQYAYNPRVVILSNRGETIMLVRDKAYRMR